MIHVRFMHSESLMIHQVALRYFATPELEKNLEFEKASRDLRTIQALSASLGRKSTVEELAFLKEPNSSF